MTETIKETALYAPVKTFLEGQGYEVKAEIGAVDVMACRSGEPPVLVELKTGFALALYHHIDTPCIHFEPVAAKRGHAISHQKGIVTCGVQRLAHRPNIITDSG